MCGAGATEQRWVGVHVGNFLAALGESGGLGAGATGVCGELLEGFGGVVIVYGVGLVGSAAATR